MCPPGVDQTMRTPQKWLLYAPELGQRHNSVLDRGGPRALLSEICPEREPLFDAWSLLARPATYTVRLPSPKAYQSRGLFDKLSNELMDMILEEVTDWNDPDDLMVLGLTCESFWYLVSQHVHSAYLKCAAPWAGSKIIIQGSYPTVLPGPLVDSPELKRALGRSKYQQRPARQLFWHGWQFPLVAVMKMQDGWRSAAERVKTISNLPESRWNEMQQQMSSAHLFPQDQTWLLRNLTAKRVVSSSQLLSTQASCDNTRDMGSVKESRFEDVLLMMTLWGYAPRGAKTDKTQGPWAGHCFDIVTEDFHRIEGGDGWEDVTVKIFKDLVAWQL
ncbi:hypothetical protein VTL71DRAFT_9761 [Oculimacula yallundae]|uniref:F-box domain-containing protein n=1 Tax=Oculimacula yallundae TaxID=86028 RepID=A0ABR4BT43_9HELO